jgi:hypothetical protein
MYIAEWLPRTENYVHTLANLPGLPDGLFRYQNSQFWFLLMAVGLENFRHGSMVCFWFFWSLGNFYLKIV